ncbi:MAG TPA: DnaJ domain-containing protein [Chthoniobacterales bacterium]|jgi:curved DNA-binding protein CbpA|nr:DnaJ domain-containing protein [Chthoniobacterales bacterium]
MTDYFALLEQPRAPWLDPEALKEVFRHKTLEQHPDTSASFSSNAFAELNEAYQVLQDPKRRLQHLLELQGSPPSRTAASVPSELQELFLRIGASNQQARLLLERIRGQSSALERSLLKPRLLEVQQAIENLRREIRDLTETANRELKNIGPAQVDKISRLHSTFAYLGRWTEQLDEVAFQLSL